MMVFISFLFLTFCSAVFCADETFENAYGACVERADFEGAIQQVDAHLKEFEARRDTDSDEYHLAHIMRGKCALSLGVDAYFAKKDTQKADEYFKQYWDGIEHKAIKENRFGVKWWQPGESIEGKSVCVIAGLETDGNGDTGSFARFTEPLKRCCGAEEVILYLCGSQAILESLFTNERTWKQLGVDVVLSSKMLPDTALPNTGVYEQVYVPLFNLPARVNANGLGYTTPDTVPLYDEQYLFADNDLVVDWQEVMIEVNPNQMKQEVSTVPVAFNHRSSDKKTAGGICSMDRTMPCKDFVKALTVGDKAELYYVGGKDHYPVRESVFKQKQQQGALGALDERDIVPDDYQVLIAEHAKPRDQKSQLMLKHTTESGPDSDKKIVIVKDSKPFIDALAVHHCCNVRGGLSVTVGTVTESIPTAALCETILLLKKNAERPRRWGTDPVDRTWLFSALHIIGQRKEEENLDGVFERLHEKIEKRPYEK